LCSRKKHRKIQQTKKLFLVARKRFSAHQNILNVTKNRNKNRKFLRKSKKETKLGTKKKFLIKTKNKKKFRPIAVAEWCRGAEYKHMS